MNITERESAMSLIQRTISQLIPCPCRTWRCRAFYAARLAAIAAGVALELFIASRFGIII